MLKKPLKKCFKEWFRNWKKELFEYKYLIFLALIIIGIAVFIDYYSGIYVSSARVVQVPDLILDYIKPIDLSFIFVYLYLFIIAVGLLYPLIFHIRTFHVVLTQFGLLVMLRAIFIIFTHLKTPINAIPITFPWIFKNLTFQNDLFFSGHTAVPFLGFLLFKKNKIRYLFLVISIILGISVLLMHRHYSIDVLSAFFITYSSYKIGNYFLNKINSSHDSRYNTKN